MTTTITRSALGHKTTIGDLYDVTLDKVLGLSLLKTSALEDLTVTDYSTSTPSTSFIVDNGYSSRFCIFEMPPEQQASYLSGMLNSSSHQSGSSRFLGHTKSGSKSILSVFKISITTMTESLKPSFTKGHLNDMLSLDSRMKSATHVVSEVAFGAHMLVVFEYKNDENESPPKLTTIFQSYIQELTTNPASAGNENFKRFQDRVTMTVYSDCECDELQKKLSTGAFPGTASLQAELLSLISKEPGRKGKPITLLLTPIEHFEKILEPLHLTISNNVHQASQNQSILLILNKLISTFDKITEAQLKFQDISSKIHDLASSSIPIKLPDQEALQDLANQIDMYKVSLSRDIEQALIYTRRDQNAQENALQIFNGVFANYGNQARWIENISAAIYYTFGSAIKKMKCVDWLGQNGVKIIKRDQADKEITENPPSQSVPKAILYYRTDNEENIKRNFQLFRSYVEAKQGRPGTAAAVQSSGTCCNVLFKVNLKAPFQDKFNVSLPRLAQLNSNKFLTSSALQNENFEITIIGCFGKSSNSFIVDLLNDEDTLFQYAINFKSGERTFGPFPTISENSRNAFKTRRLPLKSNSLFKMRITRDFSGFQVFVNKERQLNIPNRIKSFSPTIKIRITGEASIHTFSVDVPLPPTSNSSIQELPFVDKNRLDYFFVDCDLDSESHFQTAGNSGPVSETETAIKIYQNGKIVSKNLLEDCDAYFSKRIAKCTKPLKSQYDGMIPSKIAHVTIRCPGYFVKDSDTNNKSCRDKGSRGSQGKEIWLCWKCEQRLEYRFDGHFYCPCGKGEVTDFRFQCNGQFIQFENNADLYSELKIVEQFKEKNILLLGATGVGKSTWINGFANYLSYKTLDEASQVQNDIVALIPSKFTLTDADYEEIVISVGEGQSQGQDTNEVLVSGASATQQPTSYTFKTSDEFVRIIDTPGIGDTRGVEQDKLNFQYIIKHLCYIDEIHAICILLKPNQARLTIELEFCLKELLTHLHKSASHNIVFCFTNARSTFYRPGDTLDALKSLLTSQTEMPQMLPLTKDTVYCMDNEAFRFLAAVKQGQSFSEDEKSNFSGSWAKSVKATTSLLDYLKRVPVHETKSTVLINNARQLILKLSKPMAEIQKTIQTNNSVIQDKENDLQVLKQKLVDLRAGKANISQIDIENLNVGVVLNTVCTQSKCTERFWSDLSNDHKIHYKNVCHQNCTCPTGAPLNQLNCAQIQKCNCMSFGNFAGQSRFECKVCGCMCESHMVINYTTAKKTVQRANRHAQSDIDNTEQEIKEIEERIDEIQSDIKAFQAELEEVEKMSLKFAVFLKNNAMLLYNDALVRYLDKQIAIEEENIGSYAVVQALREVKQGYLAEIQVLEAVLQNNTTTEGFNGISQDDIKKVVKPLFDLPLFGDSIKQVVETGSKSKRFLYSKKFFMPQPALFNKDAYLYEDERNKGK